MLKQAENQVIALRQWEANATGPLFSNKIQELYIVHFYNVWFFGVRKKRFIYSYISAEMLIF